MLGAVGLRLRALLRAQSFGAEVYVLRGNHENDQMIARLAALDADLDGYGNPQRETNPKLTMLHPDNPWPRTCTNKSCWFAAPGRSRWAAGSQRPSPAPSRSSNPRLLGWGVVI